MSRAKRLKNGTITFSDYPEFRPNLTPREMFKLGSFGGTYWRPIYSSVTKKNYKNVHKKYPSSWWRGIPDSHLTTDFKDYDVKINKYKTKVGTTLDFWEGKNWITSHHPYGWVQWYCDFYQGKRGPDDERQIKRWMGVAGSKGRFKTRIVNMIKKEKRKRGARYNDPTISPKIRQTLQHWAYEIKPDDVKI